MRFPDHIEKRINDALGGRSRGLRVKTLLQQMDRRRRTVAFIREFEGALAVRGVRLEPSLAT